jgi:hypothetical protein
MSAPEICPRCGNRDFRQPMNYGEVAEYIPSHARKIDVPFSKQAEELSICTNCHLGFTGSEWRDEDGSEWAMAESGT